MKNTVLSIMLTGSILCSLFAFPSCGILREAGQISDNSEEIESLRERIRTLEDENESLKRQIDKMLDTEHESEKEQAPIDNTTTENQDDVPSQPKSIKLNEAFDVGEIMSITFISSEWCDEIKPSNTSSVYSYYQDVDGEKFFLIHGNIKNLAGMNLDIQYASKGELLINGKYKIPVVLETEEADGTSFYGTVKPLQTLPLIVYASVSDELFGVWETIQLTLHICNDESQLGFFFQDETPHDSFVFEIIK